MHSTFVSLIIVIAYISIILEIVFFSVPSVAATHKLFSTDKRHIDTSGLLGKVRQFSSARKFIVLYVPNILSVIAFIIPLVLIFSPGLNAYLYPLNFLNSDYLRIIGVILIITGRGVSLSAVPLIKGKNGQINTDVSLITGGVFTFSRNPIALGMLLTFLGILFIVPSFILLFGFLIYAANLHFRILLEEEFLMSRYGNQYEKYLRKARRYL